MIRCQACAQDKQKPRFRGLKKQVPQQRHNWTNKGSININEPYIWKFGFDFQCRLDGLKLWLTTLLSQARSAPWVHQCQRILWHYRPAAFLKTCCLNPGTYRVGPFLNPKPGVWPQSRLHFPSFSIQDEIWWNQLYQLCSCIQETENFPDLPSNYGRNSASRSLAGAPAAAANP